MKKPYKHSFSLCIAVLIIAITFPVSAAPPRSIASNYFGVDQRFSDGFNGSSINFGKWTYLNNRYQGSPAREYSFIEKKDNLSFLTIFGHQNDKGGGISTLARRKYGFIEFRWRMFGVNGRSQTEWIASVWGAFQNFGARERAVSPAPTLRLEVDPIEVFGFGGTSTWKGQAIAWTGLYPNNRLRQVSFTTGNKDFGNWKIHGLEYTPNYLRLWENDNGWRVVRRINYTNSTTDNTIGRAHRNALHWILWNVDFSGRPAIPKTDTFFNIDYFRYYAPRP